MGSAEATIPDTWTTQSVLQWTRQFFDVRGVDSPRLCSELLLAHVLSVQRVDLYLDYERPLSISEREAYRGLVKKRTEGVPLQHLTGSQAFRYLDLIVNSDVLIPRPETEILVDHVLAALDDEFIEELGDSTTPLFRAVDVGTGTGALILSLAKEAKFLFSSLIGVDISPEALEVATANAERNELSGKVEFSKGDLLDGFSAGSMDLVVSNPPYIPTEDIESLSVEVKNHEPLSALDGGPTGLVIVESLIQQAQTVLRSGGILALEIGSDQGHAVQELLSSSVWVGTELHQDLAGRDRVVLTRRAADSG